MGLLCDTLVVPFMELKIIILNTKWFGFDASNAIARMSQEFKYSF